MTNRRTVFILGAGASFEGGAPLMADFLDVAETIFRKDGGGDPAGFAQVFRGIDALQAVYAKASLDTRNLEAVFSAFETADLIGRLGTLEPEVVSILTEALRRVIARTLERSMVLSIDTRGNRQAPNPYQRFVDQFLRKLGPDRAAVITFNYDLGLDYGFIVRGESIEYGLREERSSGFPILKLHGSLNWIHCKKCNAVQACNTSEFAEKLESIDESHFRLSTLDSDMRCPGCGTPERDRFLVPPALTKGEGHRAIRNVWSQAAEMLATAENVFVIGYSLPPTDEFFRYLFALGTISDVRPKKFWVFDPDRAVGDRFLAFLGPTMKDRFRMFPFEFTQALNELDRDLSGERNHWAIS